MQETIKFSDKITIVVPCKNEETYISYLLLHLRNQMIGDTRIIIADCSTDSTRAVIQSTKGNLNVEIIDGGPVSIAKNRGAQLVTTPYILFIDADVRFFENTVIRDAVAELESNNLDLVGLNIKCYDSDAGARIGFGIFNMVNNILKYFSPFAVGAFMLTRRDRFEEFGGFPKSYQPPKTTSCQECTVPKSSRLSITISDKTVVDLKKWATPAWPHT